MKRFQILIIIILAYIEVFGQENPLRKYYVVDSIIRKNKVKLVFDTLNNPPKQNTITEYDTLGREILFYYTDSKFKTKYEYKNSGDTILCFLSRVSNDEQKENLLEIQKFLYNLNGEVIFTSNCYKNSNTISAQLTRFYFDSSGKITAKHFYYVHDFSKQLNETYTTNPSFYELNSAEIYLYDNKGMLTLIREITGPKDERYIDSLKYYKNGKLKEVNRFQKYGSMGEMWQENIHYSTKYVHTDSSWIEYKSASYKGAPKEMLRVQNEPYIEKVFLKNGLLTKEYFFHNNQRQLSRKYDYSFFD